jgi:uncharacterized protein (TIGR03435 family)
VEVAIGTGWRLLVHVDQGSADRVQKGKSTVSRKESQHEQRFLGGIGGRPQELRKLLLEHRMVRIGLLLLVLSLAAFAQEFEVASIRPSSQSAQTQTSAGLTVDGSMVRCSTLDLKLYLQIAYRLKNYQIVAPDWMTSTRWDITAKLPEGSDAKQIPEMMQALLVDRFQMKMHRETREAPVYGLVIGKSGLNMKESPPNPAGNGDENSARSVNAAIGSGAGTTVTYGNGAYFTVGNNRFEGKKLPMNVIADALSRFSDRPVVDMTGLKGNYDFSMEFSPEDFRAMMVRAAIAAGATLSPEVLKLLDASSGDTLFNAVEKLGLKLELRKAPIEALVIDEAQKTPTEN